MAYICNPEKTQGGLLVAGHGCPPDHVAAYESFQMVKKRFENEGGRLAYHWEIAFSPDETYPEEALGIAQEWAEEVLGEEYQCLIAVHNDKAHIHAHLIFNSVSQKTGRKFRYELNDLEKKYYPVLNRICVKHGLSIVDLEKPENEKVRQITYKEWLLQKKGYPTWRDMIRADIDHAISLSYSYANFITRLEDMGYTVNINGKHLKVTVPGMERYARTYTLGSEYTEERIQERILKSELPQTQSSKEKYKVYRVKKGNIKKKVTLTRFQRQRLRYLYLLGKVKQQPYRKVTFMERQTARRIADQMNFLFFNRINSRQDLRERKQKIEAELLEVAEEKIAIRRERKKYSAILSHAKELKLGNDPEGIHRTWLCKRGYEGETGLKRISVRNEELIEQQLSVRKREYALKERLRKIDEILTDSISEPIRKLEEELGNVRSSIEFEKWGKKYDFYHPLRD